jgi:hypothetical protein
MWAIKWVKYVERIGYNFNTGKSSLRTKHEETDKDKSKEMVVNTEMYLK